MQRLPPTMYVSIDVVLRAPAETLTSRVPAAVVSRVPGLTLTNRVPTAGNRQPGRRARCDGVAAFGCGGRHQPVQDCCPAGAAPGILGP